MKRHDEIFQFIEGVAPDKQWNWDMLSDLLENDYETWKQTQDEDFNCWNEDEFNIIAEKYQGYLYIRMFDEDGMEYAGLMSNIEIFQDNDGYHYLIATI